MITYTVVKGDTLGKIAMRFYGDTSRYPLIVAANAIPDPDRLATGRTLVVPDAILAGRAGADVDEPAPVSSGNAFRIPDRTARLNEERLSRVHPILALRGRSLIDLCAHSGLALLVTQGLRTYQEQDELYAKGRTVPPIGAKYFVTRARGGESYHNFGLAFDIVVLDSIGKANWDTAHPGWAKAAEVGKSVGLEWGGDWKRFKDMPHFQFTGNLALSECRRLYPSGLEAIWQRVV